MRRRERALRCDEEEDRAYRDATGCELRDDLRDRERRLGQIREAKRALEAREEALSPDREIEDGKQTSFADKDVRIMGGKGAFDYAHNARIGVDGDARIIVGQHVSQSANDHREVGRALDELEASGGRPPDRMSLDNGYYSGENLGALSDRGVEAYVATDRGEKTAKTTATARWRRRISATTRGGTGSIVPAAGSCRCGGWARRVAASTGSRPGIARPAPTMIAAAGRRPGRRGR